MGLNKQIYPRNDTIFLGSYKNINSFNFLCSRHEPRSSETRLIIQDLGLLDLPRT